ncbi:MAG: cell division protein ZapA [Pseudomonadota bacterium]
MADLDIAIAGRTYRVACEDGQENNLAQAAQLVAAEAESLREQFGPQFASLPESRVLLMAALMLGDRFRAQEAGAAPAGPAPEGAEEGPAQAGLFEDPAQAARIRELEAELAEARETEAAALSALEEAAGRVREMASEMADPEAEPLEDEGGDDTPGDEDADARAGG